jgi:hypothetical protein
MPESQKRSEIQNPKTTMPKLTRKTQKIFGGNTSAEGNIAVFGSLADTTPRYSNDPDEIQSERYSAGWLGATVRNNVAPLQDMNALQYLFSYQLVYLFQSGVPEWKDDQDYYNGSFCRSGGTLYVSTQDNNTGKPVTNTNYWRPYSPMSVGPTRPASPPTGHLHYDTTISRWISWSGTGWSTIEGATGDIKYVSAPTLQNALDRNPGWTQFTAATGRVLAGADPNNPAKSNGAAIGSESVQVPLQKHRHLLFRKGDVGDREDVGTNDTYNSAVATKADYNGRRDYSLSAFDTGGGAYPNAGYSGYAGTAGEGTPVSIMQPTLYAWCLIKL